jgi:hypothetical protein
LSSTKYIQSTRANYNHDFEYHGERVTLGTNVNQCTADGGGVCDPDSMIANNPLVNIRPVYNYPYPSQNIFFWTDASCTQLVKVREDGLMCVMCMQTFIMCLLGTNLILASTIFFVAMRVPSELSSIRLQRIPGSTRAREFIQNCGLCSLADIVCERNFPILPRYLSFSLFS